MKRWKSLGTCAALILATQTAAMALPLRTLPDLASVTFHEVTFGTVAVPFAPGAPELTARIPVLTDSARDFSFFSLENYDVFYSDEDGKLNADGAFLTVEGVWQAHPLGSGNIAEVELAFGGASPHTRFGDYVASFAFGSLCDPNSAVSCIAGSELLAVDHDLSTFPRMGSTSPSDPDDRFRLTIGFKGISDVPQVPEPATWLLLACGLGSLALRIHPRLSIRL